MQSSNIIAVNPDNTNSPQLSFLKKELGEIQAVSFISKTIQDTGKLSKLDMDSTAILTTAQLILRDYPMYTADEIIAVFKNGLDGVYGESFGAINYQTIMKWFKKHYAEIDNQRQMQHEIEKNSWGNNSDRIGETPADFFAKLYKKRNKR